MLNVKDPELVIVRGINSKWHNENFRELWVGFGGDPRATPIHDAYYVGLYLGAPVSKITHIGIVEKIERHSKEAVDFYLKAIIKLKKPVTPDHQIRKHEYWTLAHFGLNKTQMNNLRLLLGLEVDGKHLDSI